MALALLKRLSYAENGFMGMGIGAAMTGLRPIVEGMNMGFLLLAYNQISNNAGMLHYTSGGQFKVGRAGAPRRLGPQCRAERVCARGGAGFTPRSPAKEAVLNHTHRMVSSYLLKWLGLDTTGAFVHLSSLQGQLCSSCASSAAITGQLLFR